MQITRQYNICEKKGYIFWRPGLHHWSKIKCPWQYKKHGRSVVGPNSSYHQWRLRHILLSADHSLQWQISHYLHVGWSTLSLLPIDRAPCEQWAYFSHKSRGRCGAYRGCFRRSWLREDSAQMDWVWAQGWYHLHQWHFCTLSRVM